MTTSSYKKMLKQLKAKPAIMVRYLKHNKPQERNFGRGTKHCEECGNTHGLISKYGLFMCRRCFRENATNLGFKKFS